MINGVNVALDPVTGQTLPNMFVGTFVPGTGDRYNGMVTSDDPNYPKGFRDSQGLEPEPRLGLAWDIDGDSKTALHASAGLYHNPHVNANGLDAMARNPPAQNTPSIIYGDDGHAARGRRAGRVLESSEQRCSASSATPRRR